VIRDQAHGSPRLEDLSEEQLRKIAQMRTLQELTGEMDRRVKIERVDFQGERERFIKQASRTGSVRTKALYSAAVDRLESWCAVQGFAPLELTPARADDWIECLKAEGRAPSTVRLAVSGASAFWSWMERRHPELRNPFRGTRARPSMKPTRKLAVPSDAEIETLETAAAPWLRAAIVTMSRAGLRVGGLPELSITGSKWTTTSKGKDHSGTVPDEVRQEITRAGLPLRSPFGAYSKAKISKAFEWKARQLHAAGTIHAQYSVHDLRHSFAVRTYSATRDIYATSKALGHASVSVTETYLRSLGAEE
jgi:site-specific recombinase XerD